MCKIALDILIIFTTNNDSYLYRRYVNKNGEKVQQSMFKMSKKYQTGVWDMFSVMGGLNSVVLWQNNGLAQRDKVHFTRRGYLTLGDLFFNALMNSFERYLQNNNQIITEKGFSESEESERKLTGVKPQLKVSSPQPAYLNDGLK